MTQESDGVEIGRVEQIPIGEGRTFAVAGDQIAAFRLRDGSLRAIGAVCPHKGVGRSLTVSPDRVVVCPLRGHTFDMCTGSETGGSDMSVPLYRTSVTDGNIRITT